MNVLVAPEPTRTAPVTRLVVGWAATDVNGHIAEHRVSRRRQRLPERALPRLRLRDEPAGAGSRAGVDEAPMRTERRRRQSAEDQDEAEPITSPDPR